MGDSSLRPRVLPYLNTDTTSLKHLISWEPDREPIITCNELQEFKEKLMEVSLPHTG